MNFISKLFKGSDQEPQKSVLRSSSEPVMKKRIEDLMRTNETYKKRLAQKVEQNTKLRDVINKLRDPNLEYELAFSGLDQEESFDNLNQKIENLTTANEEYKKRLSERTDQYNSLRSTLATQKVEMTKTFQTRLATRSDQVSSLQDTVESQKSEINSLRTNTRKAITLDRMETFFRGTKIKLPEEPYRIFLEKCKAKATTSKFDAFEKDMSQAKFNGFFEHLFAVEMEMAQGFDYRNLRPIVTFQRGENDIALAKKKGITLDELKANHIKITTERFDDIIDKGFIDPKRVSAICEIGAAWGAATRYLIDRYSPDDYHSYEIDTGWAQWLKDNLGVDSKQCDGETLSDTDDNSMDICVASSCLYFMPFAKQWSYLAEFARVLKPGGIVVFNVGLIETASLDTLRDLLNDFFPRRSFGYIPKHCLDTAFPEDDFERLVDTPKTDFGYRVYRKL